MIWCTALVTGKYLRTNTLSVSLNPASTALIRPAESHLLTGTYVHVDRQSPQAGSIVPIFSWLCGLALVSSIGVLLSTS